MKRNRSRFKQIWYIIRTLVLGVHSGEGREMEKRDIILAAMSPAKGESHTPVQVQKLLFLIDRNISDKIEGSIFDFEPYNYGPFDKAIYKELENLASEDLVDIKQYRTRFVNKLTPTGQKRGIEL